ncbi:hypothetical protein CEUSTIGMA_g1918.t1 [Chlamydomonas eustigma]|uniref:Uncharacterized protein n=1 Tax=Chlamydomonas eustigma TaxID=1157962 RepID=A0A250WUS8_9CHLO|nr:hypothetical protein CEUSTIGMA_g1918.t1 [Chlamydomonas eustigma]|eukprot:GAX74469.1 hypothetical protein CEUSTIGMA_g1918.t1 [Chlamydomonas eustigma]
MAQRYAAPYPPDMLREPLLDSGFEIWHNAPNPDDHSFQIVGSEFSQVIELQVPPGQTITAEPGTMLFMSSGMDMDADMGGLSQGCTRCCCAGESMFRLKMLNKTGSIEKIALTPRFPAKIVPVDMTKHDGMIFSSGAFLGAVGLDWSIDLKMVGSAATACCGGMGLFMNVLRGRQTVFLNAGGTVLSRVLGPGEELIVDKHAILAFDATVQLEVRRTGGCMVCCCAGQGLYNAVLKGPGRVMLQSMALAKLRAAVAPAVGGSGGGGSSGDNSGGS